MQSKFSCPRGSGKSTLEINRLLEDIKRELERKSKMTNYEKYKDWFIENQLNIISGRKWGVKNGKPYLCGKMLLCCDCLFNDGSGERWLFNDGSGECEEGKRIDWLEEENY